MWTRCLWICVLLATAWVSPALAGAIPSPLQGVTVSTAVTKDQATGIFTYRYRVVNPASNDGQLRSIDIEVTRGPADAILTRDGLINGPRYLRHGSEANFQQVPMVPVGLTAPDGWMSSLRQRPSYGAAGWASMDEPFRIHPGQTLEGFQLTSYGLPGIRAVEILPDVDYANLPKEFHGSSEAVRELEDRLTFHTKTVGPKAPPATFVPLEFLNYLITLVHDSRQLGWIKVDGIHQSLLAKLVAAKRKLEAGETPVAKDTLSAFLNEVRAASCQEFSCPGNKPETSEAYALLFFNGQFLWERL